MERAAGLLLQPDHKITDIARRLGYTDNHYFSKAVKNYYHISPTQYRSSHAKRGCKKSPLIEKSL
jgi:two-component system response regulator YesN